MYIFEITGNNGTDIVSRIFRHGTGKCSTGLRDNFLPGHARLGRGLGYPGNGYGRKS